MEHGCRVWVAVVLALLVALSSSQPAAGATVGEGDGAILGTSEVEGLRFGPEEDAGTRGDGSADDAGVPTDVSDDGSPEGAEGGAEGGAEEGAEEGAAPVVDDDGREGVPSVATEGDVLGAQGGEQDVPTVAYRAHVQNVGWQEWVRDGAVAGTSGRGLRVEALSVRLENAGGSVAYRAHVQNVGWQEWVRDGAVAGTSGRGLRVEAVCLELSGEVAQGFELWYRAHVQNVGWQEWVRDGAVAGTSGRGLRIEALQLLLLPRGSEAPHVPPAEGGDAALSYRAHLVGAGWQGWLGSGATAGSTVMGRAVDALCVSVAGMDGSVAYRAHVQNVGWQEWVRDGVVAGRPDRSWRVEAVEARLEGAVAERYDLWYRAYVAGAGWLGWAAEGVTSGSVGCSLRVEAIEIALVDEGAAAPGGTSAPLLRPCSVAYRAHSKGVGWGPWASGGASAGTTGRGLRLEALQVQLDDAQYVGGVRYRAHVQNVGWQEWVRDGVVSGTTGRGLRVEAVELELTGEVGETHDLWYRAHVKGYGWLGWARNGGPAGTSGLGLRVEAVEVRALPRGVAAPGSTERPYVDSSGVGKIGYQNPAGFYQVSRFSVPPAAGAQTPFDYVTPSRISAMATREQCVEAFVGRAYEYLGTPYRWNYSCAPGVGVDCIGLVYQCAYACGMNMGTGTGHDDFNPWAHWVTGNAGWHSHDANNFWDYGRAAHVGLADRRRGDVLSWVGHVAIYLGNDQMIEATTGVVRVMGIWVYGTPRGCIRLFQ